MSEISNVEHVCPRCGHESSGPGQILWTIGEATEVLRRGGIVTAHKIRGTGWRGPDGHQCGQGHTDAGLARALSPCSDDK
jgi:hypothetical protein